MDHRLVDLRHWLENAAPALGLRVETLRPASSDASFRRYFRIAADGLGASGSAVVMDAPPPQEDVRPFLRVAGLLAAAGRNDVVVWRPTLDDVVAFLTDELRSGDLLVTIGAGDVTTVGPRVLDGLRERSS